METWYDREQGLDQRGEPDWRQPEFSFGGMGVSEE
jgi:hypothetical protein